MSDSSYVTFYRTSVGARCSRSRSDARGRCIGRFGVASFPLLLQFGQQLLDGETAWAVAHGRIPNDVGVNLEISMNKHIAHTDDFVPGNVRRKRPHLFREGAGCRQ